MIHVEEINQIERLADRRLLWNALLSQTRGANFFQSLDWLEIYWRHFGAGQRLRVLVVSAAGGPVGILPLVVRTESTRVGRVRTLTYPLHNWGTFYGPIGPNPTATLLAGLRHVGHSPRRLGHARPPLGQRGRLQSGADRADDGTGRLSPRQAGLGRGPADPDRGHLAGVLEQPRQEMAAEYRALRPPPGRTGHGQLRALSARGHAVGDDDPRWDLYDACVEVARRSWQSGVNNGATLSSPEVSEYLRETHAAAARAGGVDANLLLLDGRPVAFVYNYVYDGCVYGLRKGFDPEFAQLRPGLALETRMVEDGFRRADRCYDLGVGSLAVKRAWQTDVAASYRFTYFPGGISRVQLLRLKRWLTGRIKGPAYPACRQGV